MQLHRQFFSESEKFKQEVVSGLRQSPKRVSPKYFYDERGSRLFEQITRLPEYYPTRVEKGLYEKFGSEMGKALGEKCVLLDFGSGNSEKLKALLPHLKQLQAYIPIDISGQFLEKVCAEMEETEGYLFPIYPVEADYLETVSEPAAVRRKEGRRVIFFPGSTIGNLDPIEAVRLMERMKQLIGPEGAVLIGVDLKKDKAVMERAYNDRQGVTARFNLNLLHRMNRELGANFEPRHFCHEAYYEEKLGQERWGRIEMHLRSLEDQIVAVGDERFYFRRGETLHTESSYKYTEKQFQDLAIRAGLKPQKLWKDEQDYFAVFYLTR